MKEHKYCPFMIWQRVLFIHTCYIIILNMTTERHYQSESDKPQAPTNETELISTMGFCWRKDLVWSLNVNFIQFRATNYETCVLTKIRKKNIGVTIFIGCTC